MLKNSLISCFLILVKKIKTKKTLMSRKLFFIGGLAAIVTMIYTVLLILNEEAAEGQLTYQIILQAIYFHTLVIFFLAVIKREHNDLYMLRIS